MRPKQIGPQPLLSNLKYIDYNNSKVKNNEGLYHVYGVQLLSLLWHEHIICVMYRHSRMKHRL